MTEFRKRLPTEIEAFAGDFHGLLDQIGRVGDSGFLRSLTPSERVTDLPSLKKFLLTYAQESLFGVELPAVCKAYFHAARYEFRELIALDKAFSSDPRLTRFGKASALIGRAHLLNLRPLRENRFVQRYITALESGEVQAWHTLVYGISLSIYSVPLRQGLLVYANLVLNGFAKAAAAPLSLTAEDVQNIVEEISSLAPAKIDSLLNLGDDLFKAA